MRYKYVLHIRRYMIYMKEGVDRDDVRDILQRAFWGKIHLASNIVMQVYIVKRRKEVVIIGSKEIVACKNFTGSPDVGGFY